MTGVELHTGRMSTHKRAVVYILLYLGDIYIQYDKYKLYIYSIGFCWKTDRRFFRPEKLKRSACYASKITHVMIASIHALLLLIIAVLCAALLLCL